MHDFEYVRATTLADALAALAADDEAKPLAGGQTLTPTLRQRLAMPSRLVDISGLAELRGQTVTAETVTIGAGVRHHEVAGNGDIRRAIPALAELAGKIGDPAVRNRGTLGGSVANNDPSACYPAAVLALDGVVITSAREAPAANFFTGLYETALRSGELVTAVRFRRPDAAAWMKFPQPASRFSLVGVFLARFGSEVRVAVTGASDGGVFRPAALEAALTARFAPDAVAPVAVSASGMIEDVHGSAEYRAHLVKVMTRRAVEAVLAA